MASVIDSLLLEIVPRYKTSSLHLSKTQMIILAHYNSFFSSCEVNTRTCIKKDAPVFMETCPIETGTLLLIFNSLEARLAIIRFL